MTGASKGIGAEIAPRLAAEGAAVVNYSASKQAADRVVAAITAKGGKAVAVRGSLADWKNVKSVVAETVKAFGAIDILVNDATAEHRDQAVARVVVWGAVDVAGRPCCAASPLRRSEGSS